MKDADWQGRRSCGGENRVHVNSQASMAAGPLRDRMAETTVVALFVFYQNGKKMEKANCQKCSFKTKCVIGNVRFTSRVILIIKKIHKL